MAYEIFPLPRDFFFTVDFTCWGREVVLKNSGSSLDVVFIVALGFCAMSGRCLLRSMRAQTTTLL